MPKKHTDTIQRMLDMIAAHPGVRTAALADAFAISTNEVRNRLKAAIDAGLVVVCTVKQAQGHAQNEFRISASAACPEGKAPDWHAIKAERRRIRYGAQAVPQDDTERPTLHTAPDPRHTIRPATGHPKFCDTPAGGGDITPAANDGSLPCDHLDQAKAVAPLPPDEMPAAAGADDNRSIAERLQGAINNYRAKLDIVAPGLAHEARPYHRERIGGIVSQCSSDGIVQIHRRGETGLVLTPDEADELLDFLNATKPVWAAA